MKECPWENWILKAHHESNQDTLISAATKSNKPNRVGTSCDLGEFPKVKGATGTALAMAVLQQPGRFSLLAQEYGQSHAHCSL